MHTYNESCDICSDFAKPGPCPRPHCNACHGRCKETPVTSNQDIKDAQAVAEQTRREYETSDIQRAASFMDVKLPPSAIVSLRYFQGDKEIPGTRWPPVEQIVLAKTNEDFSESFWDGRIAPGFGTYQGGNKYGADGPAMITPSENLRNAAVKALAGLLDFVDAIDKSITRAPPA